MGITNVSVKVKNPKDETKTVEAEFLVDSGATYSVVPKSLLDKINIKPYRQQKFSLADGTTIKRKIGDAIFEFGKHRAASPVIIGKKNDSLLLGALTLEAMGLILNPFERKLYPAKLML